MKNFTSKLKMSLLAAVVITFLSVTAQAAAPLHTLQSDTSKMSKMKMDKMKTDKMKKDKMAKKKMDKMKTGKMDKMKMAPAGKM